MRWPPVVACAAGACLFLKAGVAGIASQPAVPPTRPNVVLMFPDNLGWGEVNVYGGVRGAITPRLDRLAAEGLRLINFNVEFSCTVSRAALLTGRYAIRTGATQGAGMTLWEVTIAEALQSIGYATGLFGKWHLGGNAPDNRVVTTLRVTDPNVDKPFTAEVTRRLWLDAPATLIVEVTRAGVLGGPASTTRSVYRKQLP